MLNEQMDNAKLRGANSTAKADRCSNLRNAISDERAFNMESSAKAKPETNEQKQQTIQDIQ